MRFYLVLYHADFSGDIMFCERDLVRERDLVHLKPSIDQLITCQSENSAQNRGILTITPPDGTYKKKTFTNMCACSWKYLFILFFRKNISIRWRNMCFSDVTPKWHQNLIPPKIAGFYRLLRRIALSSKILSPTCAPAHKDITPYFFFLKKIFWSDGAMCVSMTPFLTWRTQHSAQNRGILPITPPDGT